MPIKPENLKLYPKNWKEISKQIRLYRASNACEGTPQFPDCRAKNGSPHPETNSKVVLTCAHMDHDPTNNHPDNLRALCQRCHLNWDAKHHAKNARKTRFLKIGQGDLL
jgi:hypothetical protein